jgi:hypothetical protein
MKRSVMGAVAGAALLSACGVGQPNVPVVGPLEDVSHLVGVWSGTYWSRDSGRSGDIYFRFSEGADSALGDVLMLPAGGPPHEHPEGIHPPTEYIELSYVRVLGDVVAGQLVPYRDPQCGCQLRTEFEGSLTDDSIEGTFVSLHLESGITQEGRWRVWKVGG